MPLVRLLFISVDPGSLDEVVRIWKEDCAQLMIASPGCLSERLLLSDEDRGEVVSYSEWRSREDVDAYATSEAHQQIKQHASGMAAGTPLVKLYEIAG